MADLALCCQPGQSVRVGGQPDEAVQIEPGDPLPEQHPAHGRGMEGGQPTAYICQAGTCSNGITDPAALSDALTLPPQLRGQQQQRA